jgi:hypothetical protein
LAGCRERAFVYLWVVHYLFKHFLGKLFLTKNSSQTLSWTDRAISTWTKSGIKLQSGLSLDVIMHFEMQLGFQFPPDFRELYQKVNGFEDFDWNKDMFSLWSLERILKEYKEDDNDNYVGFCDYFIMSHTLGFLKKEEGIFNSYSQTEPIAKTFREAIELINTNSDLIY